MRNATCASAAELNDRSCQVRGICGAAALIIDHIQHRPAGRQFQDCIRKALPPDPNSHDVRAMQQSGSTSSNIISASAFERP